MAATAKVKKVQTDTDKFRNWASENYDKGGDTFVECYEWHELREFVRENGGYAGAIRMAKILAGCDRFGEC